MPSHFLLSSASRVLPEWSRESDSVEEPVFLIANKLFQVLCDRFSTELSKNKLLLHCCVCLYGEGSHEIKTKTPSLLRVVRTHDDFNEKRPKAPVKRHVPFDDPSACSLDDACHRTIQGGVIHALRHGMIARGGSKRCHDGAGCCPAIDLRECPGSPTQTFFSFLPARDLPCRVSTTGRVSVPEYDRRWIHFPEILALARNDRSPPYERRHRLRRAGLDTDLCGLWGSV